MRSLVLRALVPPRCFQAIERQTVANETREKTLRELQVPLEKMKQRDLATLTGEAHWLATLARETGQSLSAMLDTLWSSDVTEMRAASLIDAAQREIAEAYAEQERKRKTKTGRRR